MLKKLGRPLLAALGLVALAQTASATVYINKRYCGGDSFATCAAVVLDVTGTTVTLRIWNLSGNVLGTWGTNTPANTIFNGLGIYNVPPGVDAITSSLTMSGPPKPFNSPPGTWVLQNNASVGFMLDFAAVPTVPPTNNARNGIASACAPVNTLPSTPLYYNPCIDPSSGTLIDWVTFQFQVTQTWDATNSYLVIRGKNVTTGVSTECWTGPDPNTGKAANCYQVVPEPLTMTLMATGLVALGGVGYLRRRKQRQS